MVGGEQNEIPECRRLRRDDGDHLLDREALDERSIDHGVVESHVQNGDGYRHVELLEEESGTTARGVWEDETLRWVAVWRESEEGDVVIGKVYGHKCEGIETENSESRHSGNQVFWDTLILTMNAVLLVFELHPLTWIEAKKLLARSNFLDDVIKFDPNGDMVKTSRHGKSWVTRLTLFLTNVFKKQEDRPFDSFATAPSSKKR